MKRGTPQHPKTVTLARVLGVEIYVAVGILEMLWHFTAQYAPAGDIGRFTEEEIAIGIGWKDAPETLINGLIHARFLDTRRPTAPGGARRSLTVHDWHDHADDAIHARLARSGMAFASGAKPSDSKLGKSEKIKAARLAAKNGPQRRPTAANGGLPEPEPEPEPEPLERASAPRTPAHAPTREAPPARPPVIVDVDVFADVNVLVDPLEAPLPDRRPAKTPGSTQRRAAVAQLVQDLGRDRVAKVLSALPDLSDRSKEANGVFQKIRGYEDSLDGKVGADRFEQIERLLDEDRASRPPEKPKKGERRFDSWGRLIPENGVYTEEEWASEIERINREFEENERRKNETDPDEIA